MRYIVFFVFAAFANKQVHAQDAASIINSSEVKRIIEVLASDDMQGRKIFTPAIDKAASFIAGEFKKAGLQYFQKDNDYLQTFQLLKAVPQQMSGKLNGKPVAAENFVVINTEASLQVNENSGYEVVQIDSAANLFREAFPLLSHGKNYLVCVNSHHAKNFSRLQRLNREGFARNASVIFVLTDTKPQSFSFDIKNKIETSSLANVIGVIPGKSKPDEYVIFSAHYDHLGIGKPDATGDSIYNGANDDAAGTTAMIMLAKYFSTVKNNERSLVFVAFTAEESGGYGSQYFSRQIDADKAIAMFNIEMIGTESKWGTNSAYITGFERSDFGKILQESLAGSAFTFHPDPYPDQNLFYRSDNATLAALGVPAHTISTSKMDSEPNYHKQSDEVKTLDIDNMTAIIKSIAISSKTIISGKATPSRVAKR